MPDNLPEYGKALTLGHFKQALDSFIFSLLTFSFMSQPFPSVTSFADSWHSLDRKPIVHETFSLYRVNEQTVFPFYHSSDITNPWHLFHTNHQDNTIQFPLITSENVRSLLEKFLS